jgi:uncharacterized protein (DUF736 family)
LRPCTFGESWRQSGVLPATQAAKQFPRLEAFLLAPQILLPPWVLRCAAADERCRPPAFCPLIAVKDAITRPDEPKGNLIMKIGSFTQTEDGYAGTLRTLELNVKVKLVTAEKKTDNSPDFRVLAGTLEIGAAWKKSKEDRSYLSLILDDPSFAAPIYPILIEGEDRTFELIWNRRNSH